MKNILLSLICTLLFVQLSAQTQVTNIPTVYIKTENNQSVVDKDIQINGFLSVISNNEAEELVEDTMTIKGRGNSTWNLAKKPYRIKFNKKRNFIDMSAKAKKWIFLANHADKSLMRNAIALQIGQMLEFEFTPEFRFVDFYLNNIYQGNYLVTDQVEVHKKRVPVEEQDPTMVSEPDIEGGYLIELDGFAASEISWFTTNQGIKVTIKYPADDEINDAQFNYISNFTQEFENKLFSSDFKDPELGYRSMVDEESLINWYIASELTANPDCFWSTYLYKKREEDKFYFGPMWDYDIAFNNDNRVFDTTKKMMKDAAFNPRNWITRLLEDPWFIKSVDERWTALVKGGIKEKIQNFIDETEDLIQASQELNYKKWNVINRKVYNEPLLFSTHAEYVDYIREYIDNRVDFLNQAFPSLTSSLPSQPFEAGNFIYMVVNNNSNNALDVNDQTMNLHLWNPLDDEESQNWLISEINEGQYQFINLEYNLAMSETEWNKPMALKTPDSSDPKQLWRIKEVGTGDMYGIINVGSGYSVNNAGGSFANGTNAIVYDQRITQSKNQQWYIQKVKALSLSINGVIQLEHKLTYINMSGTLNVNLDSVNKGRVSVFAVSGKMVYQQDIAGFESSIDLNHLGKGIYVIKLDTPDGSKVIKIMR